MICTCVVETPKFEQACAHTVVNFVEFSERYALCGMGIFEKFLVTARSKHVATMVCW